jgi:hypothetical protein
MMMTSDDEKRINAGFLHNEREVSTPSGFSTEYVHLCESTTTAPSQSITFKGQATDASTLQGEPKDFHKDLEWSEVSSDVGDGASSTPAKCTANDGCAWILVLTLWTLYFVVVMMLPPYPSQESASFPC